MINQERWFSLPFNVQMGHIGSEITRARIWDDKKDTVSCNHCLERALDLIDLTKNDIRLYKRHREICYLREAVADQYINAATYDVSLTSLEKYCSEFSL